MTQRSGSSQTGALAPSQAALHVITATRRALEALEDRWDPARLEAFTDHLVARGGRVVLTGVGKSGLIAQKISATLASTGCPSFFIHPTDALHGDLGMITAQDTVLILSNSGETEEVLKLLPSLIRLGVGIASITSNGESRLAAASGWCFTYDLPDGEGCPLNFAPMASTTLQLLWGDLLAAYFMTRTGFTLERFAQLHPAGNLGARLLKTRDLMHRDFPKVRKDASLVDALAAMTGGKLGMTTVMDGAGLLGIISDGDIRRALEKAQRENLNPLDLSARAIMTADPVAVEPGTLAIEAARILESRKITFLVVKEGTQAAGILHIHDLLGAKVI
ncbi:KpsF/GutQ family sugar-phosphate isomerase [Mesoterricola silvestris]|uniref:Arabinose 5-phosphate isomerase n=1 Tax=Mesoterricola silvestris TaxID=2927979 RepID=A0AA48H755_9BACT|nr:KpsF/GutQ family sugar-phosphate isomerase [Mesoterricola silvestris]BDU73023.1 arabinose 5-phosphate isomerase [Mesoterricola silvestris]